MRNVMPEEQQKMFIPRKSWEYALASEAKQFTLPTRGLLRNIMPETYVENNFKDFYTAKLEVPARKVQRRRMHPHNGLRKKYSKVKAENEKIKKEVEKFKGSFEFIVKAANSYYERLFKASRINKWMKIELCAARAKGTENCN